MFRYNFIFTDDPSQSFNSFSDLLGDRIKLKGWEKFKGGLDAKCEWFSLISFIIFCCLTRKYTMASYYQNIIQIPHRNILKRCRMKSFLIMQIMYLTSFRLQPMQLELNLYIQFTKATRLCFMYLRCFLIHLRINNRWFDDPN